MNTDFMFVIGEYEKVGKWLIENLNSKFEKTAPYMSAEEIEEAKKNIDITEASLAFQIAMAEKIDQINDKLDLLLGKI